MSDPVRALLDELRPDVARVPLPSPHAVRERGQQRDRRRVGASAAASAAAVALVVGGVSLLGDSTDRIPAPPATASTATGDPSPGVIDLLRPDQLPGPATGSTWRAVENVDAVLGPCPVPLADDGRTSYLRGYVVDSTGGPGVEEAVSQVVQMGSAAEAEAALRTAADGVRACWGPTAVLVRADAGDEAVVLHGRSVDGSGSSAQALVMVRLGSDVASFAVSLEDRDVLPYLDALATSLPTQLETVLVLSGGQAWVTSPAELQGEWAPVVLRGEDVTGLEDMSGGPVLVTFTADEEWWGSDGCNRTSGPLAAGPQGGFTATPEGQTLVGCPDRVLNANVEVVTEARRARVYAGSGPSRRLVLLDTDDVVLGVYAPAGP